MTLTFWIIFAQTIKSQQDQEENVRQLWGTVIKTLDFMRQAQPLEEIQGLKMNQIYDCTLFLQSYGKKGFAGKYHICRMCLHSLAVPIRQGTLRHLHNEDG
jgi:hypothetical protein